MGKENSKSTKVAPKSVSSSGTGTKVGAPVSKERLKMCEKYTEVINRWKDVKDESSDLQEEWRNELRAATNACKSQGMRDCNITEINALLQILAKINLHNAPGADGGRDVEMDGGKIVGGGYAELVAQLSALVEWLRVHAGHISWCVKLLLQKIWGAAVRAARLAAEAAETGAATAIEYGAAAGQATGITDILGLLHLVAEVGSAAIEDIHNTLLGDQGTTTFSFAAITFNFAIEAVKFIMGAISNATGPYMDVFNDYINGVMRANMNTITDATREAIATPADFQAWLGRTQVITKLYWMLVSLKLVQNAIAVLGFVGAGASMAMRTSVYLAPIVYHITHSNIFTTALLLHAGFYQLSSDAQNRLIQVYKAADSAIASRILPEPDKHKELTTHLYSVLLQADLNNYKEIVKADQEFAKTSADIGEIEQALTSIMEHNVIQQNIAAKKEELAAKKRELAAKKRELDAIITANIASSINQTFSAAAGGQSDTLASALTEAGGNLTELAGLVAGAASSPTSTTTTSSSSSSSSPVAKARAAGAGAGAGSDAANGSLPRSEAEDMELGGNRSTRKRGSNKKGGAKSKRSPKSTRKGGRKQSARKRH
jgi:hypothetical protein